MQAVNTTLDHPSDSKDSPSFRVKLLLQQVFLHHLSPSYLGARQE